MVQKRKIDLVRPRELVGRNGSQPFLKLAAERPLALARGRADFIQPAVEAMIAKLRRPDRRELGKLADVPAAELFECLIHRSVLRSVCGNPKDAQGDQNRPAHPGVSTVSPKSPATDCMAAMQNAMCSSRSTPKSAAPRVMSSRLTLAANDACLS